MVARFSIGLVLAVLVGGCSSQVRVVEGLTSVLITSPNPDASAAAAPLKARFIEPHFPKDAASKAWMREGLAQGLRRPAAVIAVEPFTGDPEVGFESGLEGDEEVRVTYFVSDVGLLRNKEDPRMLRVQVAYRVLLEMQGEASSEEAMAKLAEWSDDIVRLAAVRAVAPAGWQIAAAEVARSKKRDAQLGETPFSLVKEAGPAAAEPEPATEPESAPAPSER